MSHTSRNTKLSLLLLLALSASAEAAEIRLKSTVKSQGSLVLLGDIAQITDEDPDVVRTLQRIELFPAPSSRQSRVLRLREVRELLRLNGVDLAACRFSGVETCRVLSELVTKPVGISANKPVTPPKPGETMVVAVRPLSRGHVVTESDVVLRSIEDSTRRIATIRGGGLVHQMSDVVGFELTRSVSANQPFDVRLLRRALLVRRGEAIRVTARASGVTVRTSARATEDGSQGDLIMLQSEDNRKKFLARVTGLQQAEVFARGPQVQAARVGAAAADRNRTDRGKNAKR